MLSRNFQSKNSIIYQFSHFIKKRGLSSFLRIAIKTYCILQFETIFDIICYVYATWYEKDVRIALLHIIIAVTIAVLFLVAGIVIWRKKTAQKKLNLEQMNHKAREDALDRALSNRLYRGNSAQPQAPVEVHYNGGQTVQKGVNMFRLTEKAETVTKEYLFRMDESVFLGEEHGRAAVFYRCTGNTVCCEIFSSGNAVYVRGYGRSDGQLIRGKQKIGLSAMDGIRLSSNDIIETRYGTFLIEFI